MKYLLDIGVVLIRTPPVAVVDRHPFGIK